MSEQTAHFELTMKDLEDLFILKQWMYAMTGFGYGVPDQRGIENVIFDCVDGALALKYAQEEDGVEGTVSDEIGRFMAVIEPDSSIADVYLRIGHIDIDDEAEIGTEDLYG